MFNLFLTLAVVRRLKNEKPSSKLDPGLSAGEIAPDFTVQSLSEEVVTGSMYAGRKVAFVFIFTYCAPCHDLVIQLDLLTTHVLKQVWKWSW